MAMINDQGVKAEINGWSPIPKMWKKVSNTGRCSQKVATITLHWPDFFLEHQPGDHLDYAHISPISWHNASVISSQETAETSQLSYSESTQANMAENPGGCRCSASLGRYGGAWLQWKVWPQPSRCCTWVCAWAPQVISSQPGVIGKRNAPGKLCERWGTVVSELFVIISDNYRWFPYISIAFT